MDAEQRTPLALEMKAVTATGIFQDVRRARLVRRDSHAAGANTGGIVELALDTWEAPLVFQVTSVDRTAEGAVVYRAQETTIPAGSDERIELVLVEQGATSSGGRTWEADVTRARGGGPADSVLRLRARETP